MVLVRELTISIITPNDAEILGILHVLLNTLKECEKETMIDIHICPAEEEKADE